MRILVAYLLFLSTLALGEKNLVYWDTPESQKILFSSDLSGDFFKLSNNFESQSNKIFCGPTTATILLNVLKPHDKAPYANVLMSKDDLQYIPEKFDPCGGSGAEFA